jgi:hypothetical protein
VAPAQARSASGLRRLRITGAGAAATVSNAATDSTVQKENRVSASDGKSKLGVVDQNRAYAWVSALKETNHDRRVLVWHSPALAELQAEHILSIKDRINESEDKSIKNLDQHCPICDL